MGDLLGSPWSLGGQSGKYCTRQERVITTPLLEMVLKIALDQLG